MLKEILGSFTYGFGKSEFKVTEINKFSGESSVNIRKGKKIVSYDYSIKLKWECTVRDGDGKDLG